jgi:hypothetical protein
MLVRYLLVCIAGALAIFAEKKPITIDTSAFAYFQGSEVMLYDVAAKSEKTLLSLEPLEKAAVPVPEPQRFDWQNRRVSEDSLEWSSSGKQLLLSVRGDLFLFARHRQPGNSSPPRPKPSAIPSFLPTAREWHSGAATICTRSRSRRISFRASPTTAAPRC